MYKALDLRGSRGCGNQYCLQLALLRKGREGKGREGNVEILKTAAYAETEYAGGFMNFMEE
jgi:hypothetical protein